MTLDYAVYGDDVAPNAQNPRLMPNFDPVKVRDGSAYFQSTAKLLADNPRLPASGTFTLTGSVTAGETVALEIENMILPGGSVEIATLAVSGDSLTTIAYRLLDAIESNKTLQLYGVSAQLTIVSTNPTISLFWPGPLGNFTSISGRSRAYSATLTVGGTITAGDLLGFTIPSSGLPISSASVVLSGSATTGDVVSLQVYSNALASNPTIVSYTVAGGDTLSNIATGLATAVGASSALTALGFSANASGPNVYLNWNSAYGVITFEVSSARAATETITLTGQPGTAPSALAPSPLPSELITIGGSVTTGDVLTLLISSGGANINGQPVPVQYTTVGGDTTATIATALAALINSSPALGGIFTASVVGSVIAVVWDGRAGNVGFSQSVAGTPTEYGTAVSGNGSILIPYTVVGGDTTTTIATAIKNAINANVTLANAGLTATSSSAVVTIKWNGALNPIAFATAANGGETATIGGTVTAGDVLNVTVTDAGLPGGALVLQYTALTADTTTTIATALKNQINANTILSNVGITAASSGAVLTITSKSPNQTTYSQSVTGTSPTETITLASLVTETLALVVTLPSQTVTVGGSATATDTVSLKITDPVIETGSQIVTYVVKAGDTLSLVAAGLAAAITQSPNLEAAGFSATSNAAVVTVKTPEQDQDPVITQWATGNETVTLSGTATVGDVVNVLVTNAALPSGSHNVQYTVAAGDTTLTLLAASLANALNTDAVLSAAGYVATSAAAIVTINPPDQSGAVTFAGSTNGVELATLGGTITTSDTLVITITDASVVGSPLAVTYTVLSSDTTLTILAASIAAQINATAALTVAGITATSSGPVISIRSRSVKATSYARTNGGTETITLSGGAGESVSLAGGPTETLSITNATAGSEVVTATSPLAGGAGPIIPLQDFNFSQTDANGGSTANLYTFRVGIPVDPGYVTVAALVDNQQPVI